MPFTGSNLDTNDCSEAARSRIVFLSSASRASIPSTLVCRSVLVASRASISSVARARSAASSADAVRFASAMMSWLLSSLSASSRLARSSEERRRSSAAASASATVLAALSLADPVIDCASDRASDTAASAVRWASTSVRSRVSRTSSAPSSLPVLDSSWATRC